MNAALLGKLAGKLRFTAAIPLLRVATLALEAVSNGLSLTLDEDSVVATAKKAFDDYIRTIDWPIVREPRETELEDKAWAWCEATIRAAYKN